MKACDSHLPATKRAQQLEDFADAGDQRRPQDVRWAFGLHAVALR
jgi:hypothetical protein